LSFLFFSLSGPTWHDLPWPVRWKFARYRAVPFASLSVQFEFPLGVRPLKLLLRAVLRIGLGSEYFLHPLFASLVEWVS
jgi:hypothetical protein